MTFPDMLGALRSCWGSTETFGTFTFGLQPRTRQPSCTGYAVFVSSMTSGEAATAGEIGDTYFVRGPSVTVGYCVGARSDQRPVRTALVPYLVI